MPTDAIDIAELTSNPDAPRRQRRKLRVGEGHVHFFNTSDGVQLRLIRFEGGGKGPVLLSHCIGVSSLMYSIDTIEMNLLEWLYAHGFDVWLLDHRLSIALPTSRNQSTLDDVATKDYPAAIAQVRELTGADSVQVVAHGVGSSTFTMAMLAGLHGVRAAVCSQVSTHLLVSLLNQVKTSLYLASFLAAIGVKSLTAYAGSRPHWKNRLYHKVLRLYPIEGEERCDRAVCRRITSMYGALYEHDQLNATTHDALHELFGIVNIQAFRQLARITRKGHVIRANGEDSYLSHLHRLAIPIAFIHGGENDCVLPKSTKITYNLLREKNGDLYSHHVIPNYGHVDCMFGKNAANDVYPLILDHLETTAR